MKEKVIIFLLLVLFYKLASKSIDDIQMIGQAKHLQKKVMNNSMCNTAIKQPNHQKKRRKTALKFGHRGASFSAPENTIAACKKAFELGADGIEIDIHMTADKKIIVLHDNTLKRVATYTQGLQEKTGINTEQFAKIVNTVVSELKYATIKHIDVGLWKGEDWAGEKIPTLHELLPIVLISSKPSKKIQIEIKEKSHAIIPELKRVLEKYPKSSLAESVILIGFDLEMMRRVKKEISYCHTLLIRDTSTYESIEKMLEANLDGITFEANPQLLTKEIVEELHQRKKIVGVWVFCEQDTQDNLAYFEELGVDFQTTNLPPDVVEAIAKVASTELDSSF